MKITVIDNNGNTIVDTVDGEGVYFFNADTHGSAEALIDRTDDIKDADRVVFVNAASVQSVSVSDIGEDV